MDVADTRFSHAKKQAATSPGSEAGFQGLTAAELERLAAKELAGVVESPRLVSSHGMWVTLSTSEPCCQERVQLGIRARSRLDARTIRDVLDAAARNRASNHPAVLSVRRFGCTDELLWFTTHEYGGHLLAEWFGPGCKPSIESARAFLGLVVAPLQAMHEAGLAHGALTTSSFHRDSDGTIRIRCHGIDVPILRVDLAAGMESEATTCAAPEVRGGGNPVAASDQWAVAATVVRLVSGHPPRPNGQFPEQGIPKAWRPILRRALAIAPEERFGNVGMLGQALARGGVGEDGGRPSARSGIGGRAGTSYVPSAFRPRGSLRQGGAPPRRFQSGDLVLFPDDGWDEASSHDGGVGVGVVTPARRLLGGMVLLLTLGSLVFVYRRNPSAPLEDSLAAAVDWRVWAPSARARPPRDLASPPPGGEPQTAGPQASVTEPEPAEEAEVPAPTPPRPTRPDPSLDEAADARSRPRPTPPQPSAPAPTVAAVTDAPPPEPDTGTIVPLAPGTLSMQTYPWGAVYVDGSYVGTTPLLDVPVSAGSHTIRVERDGSRPYVRVVTVQPGQAIRLTGIVLEGRSR